jgi:hypothetical protein
VTPASSVGRWVFRVFAILADRFPDPLLRGFFARTVVADIGFAFFFFFTAMSLNVGFGTSLVSTCHRSLALAPIGSQYRRSQ